jgi:hypothetical protein
MSGRQKQNSVATAGEWRAAARMERVSRAEHLALPSGATILAARPGPLEWIISGRIPQRLLAVALEEETPGGQDSAHEITREEILELARFATGLIAACVIEPAIGDGPGEIPMEEIPLEDRAFIFEWACRGLGQGAAAGESGGQAEPGGKEKVSIPSGGIEGFRSK